MPLLIALQQREKATVLPRRPPIDSSFHEIATARPADRNPDAPIPPSCNIFLHVGLKRMVAQRTDRRRKLFIRNVPTASEGVLHRVEGVFRGYNDPKVDGHRLLSSREPV
jgi:hypothetical protein